ncbi:MAG: DNA repair protein RecO [Ruminococcaceae bacterium]|nr:DNA repair protein RecO [Oscillospiraceae bacterium]
MSIATDGLVIRVNNVGEYDRIVSVLTADYGIIRAFVHGARSLKNKNASATSLLSYSHFTFSKKRDTYTITDSAVNKIFFNLRGDIVKLSLAQYFCEIAENLAPVEDEAKEYLRIMLNSLHFLSESARPSAMLKAITELRMLAISGYTPDIVACRECACYEADTMFFDAINGELYCPDCRPPVANLLPIGKGVLAAMRHIVYSSFDKLYNFSLPDESLDNLSHITETFLLSQIEHRFTALEFYKNL